MKKPFVFIFLLIPLLSYPQMKAPHEWVNYEEVFSVKNNQFSYDFDVTCIYSSAKANVFWPGEKVHLSFQIINNTGNEISEEAGIEVIRYRTLGRPNDIWLPEVEEDKEVQIIRQDITIAPNGFVNLEISPEIPEVFGGYAIVFDLGKHGRRLATSLVRTFKPNQDALQYPKQSLDDLGADFLSRIGVKAIRMGISYYPTTHRDYVREMEALDKKLREYHHHNITVLLMFMEGPADLPLGTPRSFLDRENTYLKTKQDYVWLPSLDNDFTEFVKRICIKHGWPNGCVTGVHLWNEPWEGISISGWQSDMLRYREIYKAMANGVIEARRQGADVLIGGCDSNSNAWDKLFADGNMEEFLPIFDFLSIHYQGMDAPSLYPEWISRKHHKGRVLIWDTESWVGNTDDRIGVVVATNRSAGYDRSMGIYGGYMISRPHTGEEVKEKIRTETGWKEIDAVTSAWSPSAAMGAVQHMVGERAFNRLLFTNGLPWIMLFDGYNKNPDDGTVVICGDIGEAFGAENVLFRGVRGLEEVFGKEKIRDELKSSGTDPETKKKYEKELNSYKALRGGKMSIKAHPSIRLFDFYGNEITSSSPEVTVPLNSGSYYFRTDGSKGSFDKLIEALKKASVEGYEPLDIIAYDFTDRIKNKPEIKLRLTNVLNQRVKGELHIKLGDLHVEYPKSLSFNPHETKKVNLKVLSGDESLTNSYPLSVRFDAGSEGLAVHYEDMHVNLISRKTVKIDGILKEYDDMLPQIVSAGNTNPSVTEAAWYPFKTFSQGGEGLATAYLSYDDEYFYFAAKVMDQTPHEGTYRFESRNDDEFFYPDTAFKPDPFRSFKKNEGSANAGEKDDWTLLSPDGKGRIMHYWMPDENNIGLGVDISVPYDTFTQVAFYLPNINTRATEVEILNLDNQRTITAQHIDKLWDGTYLVYDICGNVRVSFRGKWYYDVKLAGIFLDETITPSSGRSEAVYVMEDFTSKGNWTKHYGKAGYWIFGLEPFLPDNITIKAVDEEVLTELIWPENVRHFTYRKDPVLPCNSTGMGLATDNIQIAFNVIPLGEDGLYSHPKGTMPRYTGYKCTDYEYALNQVAPRYGGGTEIWKMLVPGMPRKHFYPRQPKSPYDGPVKEGKLVITHEGNTRITECAIPWSEIPDVRAAMEQGIPVKFSFRVNDNGAMGNCLELARERSVSKRNSRAFHADWKEHWANEVEFMFEKPE